MKIFDLIFNLVNPKWLIKIDDYLLLNYPRFWVTKIHYVVYNGLLANIAFNLFVGTFLQPTEFDEFIWYFVIFVMFAEAGVFIFWFIQQSLYDVEKEYGDTSYKIGLVETLVYVLCTVIITSTSLTMTATAIHKTANVVGITSSTECNTSINSSIGNKFSARTYDESSICNDIKYFIQNRFSTDNYRIYQTYDFLHIIFLNLGIFLLIIRKYSSWRILGWIGAYILLLIIMSIFFSTVLSAIISGFDLLRGSLIYLTIVNLFILLQSIRLIKTKIKNDFMLINFAILPLSLSILLYVTNYAITQKFYLSKDTLLFVSIFVLYIFLSPLYKAVLNRTLVLPKE
ncbi:hypothetical protein [Nostoc sp. UHCC 0251]|uniref:hypothetical protein n=1 Tax=Nostoc sp. UHCC 0251 TaxID=3110240 RepID=UPI002B21BB40|nr:hypothetical protein [Nostoc sp. UHCC 0251]MEA5622448.1 hypothetical protein [Nostoc sp. UHCC 0251]